MCLQFAAAVAVALHLIPPSHLDWHRLPPVQPAQVLGQGLLLQGPAVPPVRGQPQCRPRPDQARGAVPGLHRHQGGQAYQETLPGMSAAYMSQIALLKWV